MNNRKLAQLGPVPLAVIAMAVSLGGALLVLFVTRLWRGAPAPEIDTTGAERIPPQPDVEAAMPAGVPGHFTEELVIPGFTETGADVERDDGALGRSPEGV
jgi:hypothetical protein